MTNNHNKEVQTIIILAGKDKSGLGIDHFDRTRHFLPIVNKPLINYLVEDLKEIEEEEIFNGLRKEFSKKIIVLMGGRSDKEIKQIFKESLKDFENEIFYFDQDPFIEIGSFEALKTLITAESIKSLSGEDIKNNIKFPIMLIYGDIFVNKDYFKKLKNCFRENIDVLNVDLVFGLYDHFKRDVQGENRSRYGYIICDKQTKKKSTINGNEIINILHHPLNKDLIINNETEYSLIDMGIFIFSENAFNTWEKRINIWPSPHGIFSFDQMLRIILSKYHDHQELNIPNILGVVGDDQDYWQDINLPWELLEANIQKLEELCNNEQSFLISGKEYCIIKKEDKEIITFDDNIDLKKNIQWDEINNKGINPESIIVDKIIIPKSGNFTIEREARIRGPTIIGENCKIHSYSYISKSSIGNGVVIHPFAYVRDSIIMRDAQIYNHALIENSILGRNVFFGGGSIICFELLNENEPIRYYSETGVAEYYGKFGAVIGNLTKIGVGTNINPGRKIGSRCIIWPDSIILHDIKQGEVFKP